ncbi:hypothetical protein Tco_1050974 [Tanacetum coccineum]
MKVEESLNVTFDETPPPSKTSPLEDDDLVEEEAIKKQSALAIFTTEAEYVSAEKACQQALWMKQALVDYGIRRKDLSRAGPTSAIRAWRETLLKKLYFHFTMTSQNLSQTYPMPSPLVSSFTFPSTTKPVFSASTSEPVFESPNHTQPSQTTQPRQLQQYHTTTVSNNNAKFPYLKKEEYETWVMKIERDPKGNIMILPPVSVEEHIAVQRETKARTILLQSLPEDHMADFHHLDDARDIGS